jgi:hypothetical protein
MLWKIGSRLGEAFSLAFQSLSHPRPRVQRPMSARVSPHVRESRDGILPKRDEYSKRKLSEQHARVSHITHSFSTGQKAKLKLFLREFCHCFLTKLFCARKFSRNGLRGCVLVNAKMNLRELLRAWRNRRCPRPRCREASGRVRRGLSSRSTVRLQETKCDRSQ